MAVSAALALAVPALPAAAAAKCLPSCVETVEWRQLRAKTVVLGGELGDAAYCAPKVRAAAHARHVAAYCARKNKRRKARK